MKMLVKYVFNKHVRHILSSMTSEDGYEWFRFDRGIPIGCIVAVGRDKIGWSRCDARDQFNKKTAKNIAIERAYCSKADIIPNKLRKDYVWMQERAKHIKWEE